ncbi:MAG: hypothetical protein WA947_05240 [Phormidesmis sp.]
MIMNICKAFSPACYEAAQKGHLFYNCFTIGSMSTRSLVGIAGFVAVVFLAGRGLHIYLYASCGQYHIFEPPCSTLLSAAETQAFLDKNQDVVDELTRVSPGFVQLSTREESRCPSKSILTIEHPSENECDALNKILDRDAFDVPYKIVNY